LGVMVPPPQPEAASSSAIESKMDNLFMRRLSFVTVATGA
jgi:hypothetical protein